MIFHLKDRLSKILNSFLLLLITICHNAFAGIPPQVPIKHSKELCYIKSYVRDNYEYKRPFFFSNSQSRLNLIVTRKPSFFEKKAYFKLIGLESKIHPLLQGQSLTYWHEYDTMGKGMNLDKICRPDLNKGKCLFRIIYEGNIGVHYEITINSVIFSYKDARVSIYSNNNLLVFPSNCE